MQVATNIRRWILAAAPLAAVAFVAAAASGFGHPRVPDGTGIPGYTDATGPAESGQSQPEEQEGGAQDPADTTRVEMRNVDFHVDRDIPLRIRHLSGTMRAKTGGPVLFDDKRSFIIGVESGEVGLTGRDLSLLLNRYVFGYQGSPLTNISVTPSGTGIIQRGTLRKVFPMRFEIHAQLSVLPDGRIRIRPTRTEILGLHVDRLMQGLGLALDEVIDLKQARGASVSGNDIILEPTVILPPPTIEGRVTAVRVEGNEIVQTFGGPPPPAMQLTDTTVRNYMYYRGGTLRFGKLMMLDADLLITELDPTDPFRFELDRYQDQLVAGYSRSLRSGGLLVYMRDVDKLSTRTPPVP